MAKNLIVDTITIHGIGNRRSNAFKSDEDAEAKKVFDLSKICGRTLSCSYSYLEESRLTEAQKLVVKIPKDLDEAGVRQYIINTINNQL